MNDKERRQRAALVDARSMADEVLAKHLQQTVERPKQYDSVVRNALVMEAARRLRWVALSKAVKQ